jgi:hypothetical protein
MASTDFIIRDAVLEDADAIARVSAESWRCGYRGILPDEVLAAIDVEKRAAPTIGRTRICSTNRCHSGWVSSLVR